MRILKIKGKTENLILEQIQKEYGDTAVILSTQEDRPKGLKGLFAKSQWIMTIAIEDEKDKQEVAAQAPPLVALESSERQAKEAPNVAPSVTINSVAQDATIQALRKEIASMREEVKFLVRGERVGSEETTIFSKIGSSLKQEGVHEEVVSQILEGTEYCESIEDAARVLYTNLSHILPMVEKEKQETVTFFIGSTGVGKTTTIAKLTAESVLNQKKSIALFTADTYRIAAIEQLKTYADILDVPIEIIYSVEELDSARTKWRDKDGIFIDTAGRSHKNTEQIEDLKHLLDSVPNKKVYLVLNMSTNYKDVKKIVDQYCEITDDFELIITKMDETDEIGNLINIAAYTNKPIAYMTTGQNVPDDIQRFNQDEYVKMLLGRIKYE